MRIYDQGSGPTVIVVPGGRDDGSGYAGAGGDEGESPHESATASRGPGIRRDGPALGVEKYMRQLARCSTDGADARGGCALYGDSCGALRGAPAGAVAAW